ncbi:metal-dependent hydrolase [Corynebacterium sp. YIM 101645]|uniref:Metal-dependent hydrolase n=1 Tax=Corynebacterium lemuris TaxID=1859292 RepID=A0ABT2FTM4_9CORY|nr:metal-dependent hydrolase [Corynebacterium lemuris]MCS5478570.1 metal-dependent hydrolase [Corynebacterium lemuris]
MGPTHAMSGAAVGLAVAQMLPAEWGGVTTVQETFVYAGLAAGAALLPDLDSPQATVARSFGPLSQVISRGVENFSQGVVNLTRGRRDPRCNNGHRTLTHTVWFALAAGAGATALIGAYEKTAVIGLLFFLLSLAIRGLLPEWSKKHDWIVVTGAAAALAYGAWAFIPAASLGLVMGSAVTVGVATHLLGDMATKAGIPAFAPVLPLRGRRWWKLRLPGFLSIKASGPGDKALLSIFSVLVVIQIGLVASPPLITALGL